MVKAAHSATRWKWGLFVEQPIRDLDPSRIGGCQCLRDPKGGRPDRLSVDVHLLPVQLYPAKTELVDIVEQGNPAFRIRRLFRHDPDFTHPAAEAEHAEHRRHTIGRDLAQFLDQPPVEVIVPVLVDIGIEHDRAVEDAGPGDEIGGRDDEIPAKVEPGPQIDILADPEMGMFLEETADEVVLITQTSGKLSIGIEQESRILDSAARENLDWRHDAKER